MLLTTNPPNSLSVNDAKTHCYPLHFDLISCLRGQKSRLIGYDVSKHLTLQDPLETLWKRRKCW